MSGSSGWTHTNSPTRRLAPLLELSAFAVAWVMLVGSAHANDPCRTVGTTTTCSGDQSAGIAFNPNNGTTSLWVQSLTVPIAPVAGTSGINFQSLGANGTQGPSPASNGQAGSDLSTTTDSSVRISTSGGAPGILVTSTGGNGADAFIIGGITGFPGGAGAQGGAISVGNGGSISTAGTNAFGISAQSIGGTAGLNAITGGGGLGGVVTVTNSGSVATNGTNAFGIFALSTGGNGFLGSQDNGAAGASSGNISVTNSGSITTQLAGSAGIFASSLGGTTGNSSSNGASAGSITISNTGTITTSGSTSLPILPLPSSFGNGITALGTGGAGSDGKNENRAGSASGGNAGIGGVGSAINVTSSGTITANGLGSFGIYLQSVGGAGGTGGAAGLRGSTNTGGGDGGTGGAGGAVTVAASGTITTSGSGIAANSLGGVGGNGGSATGTVATGRPGGDGGTGGDVTVTTTGLSLTTTGTTSVSSLLFTTGAYVGILAQSQGGNGGNGGDASDNLTFNSTSGNGGGGGTGGTVTISGSGSVSTAGAGAVGIFGQSLGGNGGNGAASFGFTTADGRNGGAGGNGGTVNLNTSVNVTTSGNSAHGIAALSQGGNSGNGGTAQGASANAGNSATAGSGGMINLTSNGRVTTSGATAAGLFALSAGGTGGSGNSADGVVALGGLGGNGGDGGAVTVTANGTVSTAGSSSAGISAQSTGGGGGNGASAGAAGGSGGAGGNGGAGSAVVVNTNGNITTKGQVANGVFALSGGGAGGTGGSATGAIVTNGGSGGTGGAGGDVTVTTAAISSIGTSGILSNGIVAKSLGAAGGNGGNSGAAVNTPGGGGTGGTSGVVTVTTNGAITTSGFGAFAIQAESTGGGGGTAASGSGIVSLGGTGGAASNGGIVNVTNNGSIATSGLFSHGIAAASVGGGGGAGSQANDFVALGGSGNSSGDGNSVTITNAASGAIRTSGLGAYGIYAESVGGGGGNGGGAKGLVSIGGAGSTGGNGGQVNVINNGLIATSGIGGNGIFAQSVGGGGGDGGSASSFAALASVAIGGSGGVAGSGSLVLVDNTGTIQVSGFRSSAIFAQSLGGGGGNGGDGTLDCGCSVQYAVGGKGGASGAGGDVRVFNSGTISSTSDLAPAIFAQSVGGGGGSGGAGYGFGAGLFNVGISVGGAGGSAGGGGTVTVNQSGAIVTTGINSNGITAYSIGGGGGFGGSSASRTASAIFGGGGNTGSSGSSGGTPPGTGSGPSTFGVDFSFGGSGGAAGDGGAVNVSNTGFIVTGGAASSGIFAQSVGGGGGNGGDASATSTAVNEGTASTISLALSMGGQGGAGGKGGTVTVNNVGKIFTVGDLAPAIVAQSVGGGGGMGGAGTASSDTVGNINNFLPGNIVNPNPNTPPSDPGVPNSTDRAKLEQLANGLKEGTKISIAVGIGGNGGTANDGGDVHVTNDGSIVTFGFGSQGIFAQSVGGGGGTAAGGGGQSSGGIAVGVGVAGQGGGGGKGGDLFVTNTGMISTFGDDSAAIFAQSIGGGGGLAMVGDGHVGLNPKGIAIAIGGTTGSSGAGGNIAVTQNGAITTIGDRAYGILAESVGGGGGVGGTGDGVNLGAVVVGGRGGAGGAGGTVQVTDTGGITTFGNGAYGIVAQSIGGGGGVGGDAAGSNPHLGSRAITVGVGVGGAAGEAGDGHAVTISSTGSIMTSGIAAYGILAQSIGGGGGFGGSGNASGGTIAFAGSNGGAGAGGAITIDQTGNVITSGLDSHAIFAQSVGGNGGGNINVNIHGGLINGGTGSAAGIYLDGGNTNVINISSGAMVTAQSGFAIQATDGVDQNNVAKVIGNTTVNNSGILAGNVDLGSGTGVVNNLAGATFATGSTLNLGSGSLINNGRLDIGGVGNVVTTSLTGNFLQNRTGTYAVDVRFGGASDLLAVSGVANVHGTIEPHLLSLLPNTPATILTATNGFIGLNDVTAINSPTVTYGVQFVGNSLQLVALNAQFVSPAFAASLTPNELAVANQLQNIWNAGATPGIGPAFAALANLTDPQTYAQVVDRLHPGPYLAQATISTFTGLGFVDSMLSCHLPTGPYAPLTEVPCDWGKLTGSFSNQGISSNSTGFRDQSARLQAGRQVQLAPDWFGEFAFGYETGRTTSGTFATTQADRYDFGAALKHQIGPWLFAAALDAGYEHLNATRFINFAGSTAATSSPSVWRLDSRFRAAYVVESNGLYFKPSLDLDAIYTALPAFSEAGAGALGLNVAAVNKVTFAATPTIELGQTWLLSNGSAVRPYVRGGATVFSNNTWSVNSTFEGAPAGTAPFTTLSLLPQTLWKVSAGIDIFGIARIPNLDLRLEYEGRFGASYSDQTGLVKLSRTF